MRCDWLLICHLTPLFQVQRLISSREVLRHILTGFDISIKAVRLLKVGLNKAFGKVRVRKQEDALLLELSNFSSEYAFSKSQGDKLFS
jgi:hypothetical protein